MKTMGAAKVKTHFLSILDEVEKKREPILVTKKGKPIAKVVPIEMAEDEDPLAAFYFGPIEINGDIVAPAAPLEDWKALK